VRKFTRSHLPSDGRLPGPPLTARAERASCQTETENRLVAS
jgi:hypothetical protein